MKTYPSAASAARPSDIDPTRRRFLQTTALAATAFTVSPNSLCGQSGAKSPSQKLNIAGIGVGGMGRSNLKKCAAENIVALCDVDQEYAAKTFREYPAAKVYRDFSGPLSETVLMGNLAVRFPNQQLLWDGENIQVKNHNEANAFVRRKYRPEWSL